MKLIQSNYRDRLGIVCLSLLLILIAFTSSMLVGQYPIPFTKAWGALWSTDPNSIDHVILTTIRLSRSLIACSVGAGLAVAGVLMQSLTRNPLASPAVFGVNSGAVFLIVLFTEFLGVGSLDNYIWIAFAGSALGGGLVYGLGCMGRDGLSPVRVVIAGAAISALFMAFTQGILIIGQEGLDSVLFWVAGSVSGHELSTVSPFLPYIYLGILAAILLSPHINVLLSGDDIATGLGQSIFLLKIVLSLLIVSLAGLCVSIAGNIGFIGLIVPHMARAIVGNNHQWLLPLSAIWGAILLLLADVLGRIILAPQVIPIGVMTALLGAPFFIFLARKGHRYG
ncbi:iron ABC transporter permease [Vibrio gazogenes]|uniref:Iron complex transport system permease protein n=1 Tax=Vibrio gazogenes DSM 21264 = NBRC 103151 TaxID=1123492 RepID=A0A1M4UQA8_VIBGA|nr:iron ABC transporter permease [Vibrio gazogenes]USP15709.1 iron ABC transporter permease [Vibrio gazogenes]SHE58942.1 iron complex transport system permease protein [Vibrio gazogenes DSM 21264] [Vibrio gazogenes DSM 21264 = NBRC 103151]SJN56198.1 putative siderophore transport system permease protein YfiZ precursor [Vibrio gazogenes]